MMKKMRVLANFSLAHILIILIVSHQEFSSNASESPNNYENTTIIDGYFTQLAREILSNDTKSTLIDLQNFEFIIDRNTCDEIKPSLLIMIVSAAENYSKRKVLRETWAKKREDVGLFFLLGNSEKYNEAIKKENEEFQDILQGNFEDTYRNLTYKYTMALKWVTYYCPGKIF